MFLKATGNIILIIETVHLILHTFCFIRHTGSFGCSSEQHRDVYGRKQYTDF